MGFFLRKTKKFGLFNLNLSKNGLGFSFGIKGLRISAGSRGLQLNASHNGLYFRKSLNKKLAKEKAIPEEIIIQESPKEIIEEQPKACLKRITKSPEQENFEFILSLFTAVFLIAFVGLFFKFWLACVFGIFVFVTRNIFINKNPEKFEVYKLNPEPQLYYLGKTKKQIEELRIQAEEQNSRIDEQTRKQNQEKRYK